MLPPPGPTRIFGGQKSPGTPHAAHASDSSDSATTQADRTINGRSLLALPGFANVHAHSDKSWWGKPWQPYGGVATTQGRIEHEREHRDRLGIPGVQTSTQVMQEYLRHGTTVQRTHVDVDTGVGLRGIDVHLHDGGELGAFQMGTATC